MRKSLGCCVLMTLCFLLPAGAAEMGSKCEVAAGTLAGIEKPVLKSTCSAYALCGSSSPVSCFGASTCQAVDQNCSIGQQGFVRCDNDWIYCPECEVQADPCGHLTQQFPGCSYTYDAIGDCCISQNPLCPQEACL